MTGHLFIVHGDLTAIACDAILVPTDGSFSITHAWDSLELEQPADGWGGRNVMQYRTEQDEPEIWLGRIGKSGNANEFAGYEQAVTEFISQAQARIRLDRAGRIHGWPRLRLGLNVVGSGEGGARTTKGGLILGLVGLLRTLAQQHEVDIIFATFGDKAYAAAQRARRKLLANDKRAGVTEAELKWRVPAR